MCANILRCLGVLKFKEGKKIIWYLQWKIVERKEYLEKQTKEQGTDSLAASP